MFDKIKDLWALKGQMAEMKKRMDAMVIKTESEKKLFEITINGSQEVQEIKITGDLSAPDKAVIEQDLKQVINKAVKESLAMAAQAMGNIAGITPPQA